MQGLKCRPFRFVTLNVINYLMSVTKVESFNADIIFEDGVLGKVEIRLETYIICRLGPLNCNQK